MAATPAVKRPRRRTWDVIKALGRPRVAIMLLLGISSGLPFALVGATLTFWLAARKIDVTTIGLTSAIGFAYTFKFIWGAVVDRIKLPLIGHLGRRRSWMLVSQVVVAAAFVAMAAIDPKANIWPFVVVACAAAIGSAFQDTVIDAWRIEIAADVDELGLLTAANTLGYKLALTFTEAVILAIAKRIDWPASYVICSAAMGIGAIAVALAKEPVAADLAMERKAIPVELKTFLRDHGLSLAALAVLVFAAVENWGILPEARRVPISYFMVAVFLASTIVSFFLGYRAFAASGTALLIVYLIDALTSPSPDLQLPILAALSFGITAGSLVAYGWTIDAVSGPIKEFFRGHGAVMAALMLAMITLYHLSDYGRGAMVGPYYTALKIDNDTIAWVRLALGTPASFVGIALGGLCALRIGNVPTLILGAILQPIAVAAFAPLGFHGGDFALASLGGVKITAFEAAMTFDSIAFGFAGVALVSYMSTLTSLGYTATQYALLTSAMAFTGKSLKTASGAIEQGMQHGDPLHAFANFYLLCGLIGVPAIFMCSLLAWAQRRQDRARAAAAPEPEPASVG